MSRTLRDAGLVIALGLVAAAAGFFWSNPAPLFSSDHAVPRVIDLDLRVAQIRLTGLGYHLKLAGARQHPTAPRSQVIAQDPPAGVVLPRGSAVEVVTSAGPAEVAVPDLVGFALPQGLRVLEAAGLKGREADSSAEGADEPGVILATRPAAGTMEDPGSTIGLVLSVTAARP